MTANVIYECNDSDCTDFDLAGDHTVLEFDPPLPLDAIPVEAQRLPEGVTFEPSEETIDIFLSYF